MTAGAHGQICRQHRISPTKMLLPLSFASILGGTCTLIGTSANILASSIATERGLDIAERHEKRNGSSDSVRTRPQGAPKNAASAGQTFCQRMKSPLVTL